MKKKASIIIFLILQSMVVSGRGLCLDAGEIVRLQKAGISSDTIQLMVREKTLETCAFTVQEILDLKGAGLSNETIQALIREGSFLKDTEPTIYGKDIRSVKFTTIKDIIELKDAGVSDEVIRAIVMSGSGDVDDTERQKAWDMLENMKIRIDTR